jgi:hypothetical protein
MNKLSVIIFICLAAFFISCKQSPGDNVSERASENLTDSPLVGEWMRMSYNGPLRIHFKKDGTVEYDFNNDGKIEVTSTFDVKDDTIVFTDREGKTCPEPGTYQLDLTSHYLSFNLIDDNCGGRIKKVMAFWVRPDYKKELNKLNEKISESNQAGDYLTRARMYLAVNKPDKAKADFDYYIENAKSNARIYANRASTCFPGNMKGVVSDCNKALELDAEYKNAYFLRGLALYELGKKEEACQDFNRAIELGFSVLRSAEKHRCAEYWDEQLSKKQ